MKVTPCGHAQQQQQQEGLETQMRLEPPVHFSLFLDFISNPVGLFTSVHSGVVDSDIFYEPF